jgi:hypothetical protein
MDESKNIVIHKLPSESNSPNFANTEGIDWVWPVKHSDFNPELACSIRSVVKNANPRNIVITGYKPRWINDKAIFLRRNQVMSPSMNKYFQSAQNTLLACYDDRISDKFVLMNDDFFIMRPVKEIGYYYRAELKTVIEVYSRNFPRSPYLRGMKTTYQLLRSMGIDNPLSYELHVPMVYEKQKRIDLLKIQEPYMRRGEAIHTRTLYGNIYEVGGERMLDCKIVRKQDKWHPSWTFLSTEERTFNTLAAGRYVQQQFNTKCKYEK